MVTVPFLAVIGIAVMARLVTLFFMPGLAFGDTNAYLEDGRGLFETGQIVNHLYMPLYSVLAYVTGGGTGTKLVDIGLSVVTVVLIRQLSLEIFQRESYALTAALMAAVYPHFLFYSVARLSETLFILLICAAFLAFYRLRFNLGSILLVLAILTRPSADLVAPVLVIGFAAFVHRKTPGQCLAHLGKYLVIYSVLMSPWWVHNYVKYDTFVRLSLGNGPVLYAGNNERNTSGGGVINNKATDDVDYGQFSHIGDPVARNTAMKNAAFRFILDNPGRFFRLSMTKFVRFWRLWPYAPEYRQPHIIVASILSYGSVLMLAILFLIGNLRDHWRVLAPLLIFSGYLTAIHMVTIGSIRYRLPVEPFLIILAVPPLLTFACLASPVRRLLGRVDAPGGRVRPDDRAKETGI